MSKEVSQADQGNPSAEQPENTAETPKQSAVEEKPTSAADPVLRTTLIMLLVCGLLFVWYLLADLYAPWTDQARVQAFVVPIAPKVAGKITQVNVHQDQVVKAGDILAQIDTRDYQVVVSKAEAALEQAGQDIGASTDAVAVAEAKLDETQAQLAYVQQQADRYIELGSKGVVSKADTDKAVAEVKKAKASVRSAQADLDKAREQLGREGEDNPRMRDAMAALDKARVDLAETTLRAPSDGGITNLLVDEGHFANAGAPLMTFVSFTDLWLQANLRENSLANLKAGDPVEIALDSAPGRVFPGEIASIGFAVDQPSSGDAGDLVTIKSSSGWLRDAQRFPVVIKFTGDSTHGLRRLGGQADVQFYTEGSVVLNSLGRLWIRFMSLLSYAY